MDKQLASDIDHAVEGEDLRDRPLDMRGGSRGRQTVQQTTKDNDNRDPKLMNNTPPIPSGSGKSGLLLLAVEEVFDVSSSSSWAGTAN
ncbi:hypothetical protein TESG_08598 [Trichophyton tonsurans CBS 112818]|uniref:Uncharacterized protein n=2 Tax=Trichophyton TaxID=5550 RepID=F2PHT1_TRIEC|nr:hypothetical protein TESG_08598 [Trichophyton tonsurans CBS 112818]EGE01493.1 hypothetical protein TEQG_08576 [Trichophyton equinum CBS 127.97]